jgi:hypothetical protein
VVSDCQKLAGLTPRLGWLSASKIRNKEQENVMTLNDKQIKEFQRIHKKVFGKHVTKEQAMTDGLALIRLVYLTQPRKEV